MQVQLTENQIERLRRKAAERHVSIAALVREAVADSIGADEGAGRRVRALEAVGRFRSGISDVSTNHDRHLDDAFAS